MKIKPATLAKTLGASESRISNILKKKNRPDSEFLEKIALNYGNVNMDWLLLGTGEMLKDKQTKVLPKKDSSHYENKNESGNIDTVLLSTTLSKDSIITMGRILEFTMAELLLLQMDATDPQEKQAYQQVITLKETVNRLEKENDRNKITINVLADKIKELEKPK